jgi:hypothetical protein
MDLCERATRSTGTFHVLQTSNVDFGRVHYPNTGNRELVISNGSGAKRGVKSNVPVLQTF